MRPRGLLVGVIAAVLAITLSGCAESTSSLTSTGFDPQPGPSATTTSTTAPTASDPAASPTQPAEADSQPEPSAPAVKLRAAKVVRVVDGDTAVVRVDGRNERVRFIGVDTPESTIEHDPYGEEASAYTKRELTGKRVFLETDAELRDRYDRLLAYVWLSEPTKISDAQIRAKQFNARLLLNGYAQMMTYPPNVKYVDYYKRYQSIAREEDRGLWGLTPAASKRSSSGSSSGGANLVGSQRSMKFHSASCQWGQKIAAHNLVRFASRDAALDAGYAPCKVCRP